MTIRWRGREGRKEQVANACDSFPDLSPASETPAALVKAAWLPLQRGQEVPLIGEDRYGYREDEEDFC